MNRIIRCTIEMELHEGEHFNGLLTELTDEEAHAEAKFRFLEFIALLEQEEDIDAYVQTKTVEAVS